MYIYIFKEE